MGGGTVDAAVAARSSRSPVLRFAVPAVLLVLAATGWWWSARMVDDMSMSAPSMAMDGMSSEDVLSFAGFVVAWLAMMAAMMLPAISPIVQLYGRAAAAGRVAPLPFFVAGYLAVWTSIAVPAYFVWRELMDPLSAGDAWVARVAGGVLLSTAVWQLTPLKSACLRHCRSPISFFLRFGSGATRPAGAVRMGVSHGAFCLGCCWALMAALVALGTMNLGWMIALSLLIFVEKNAPAGERIAVAAAVVFAVLGVTLLVRTETLTALT